MQVSMELLILELGILEQPLLEQFEKYGARVTLLWLKSLWEKVSRFKIEVKLSSLDISPPREGDSWFMKAVESLNVADSKELLRINRVRIHQQVLFVSDILDASGKCIDRRYLNRKDQDEQWLTITFPNEKLP
jgi:hypothetical protein